MKKARRKYAVKFLIPIVLGAFAACRDKTVDLSPPDRVLLNPTVEPLRMGPEKKIDWDHIKSGPLKPLQEAFDPDKLPAVPLDSTALKPFSKPVENGAFNYNTLPQKTLDVNKLPVHPLKFFTSFLPQPRRIIKTSLPKLKKADHFFNFEFGQGQGFPDNIVVNLYQDRSGFLWITTINCLYRYDGETLTEYLRMPANSFIADIAEDSAGRFWMTGNDGSLMIMDLAANTLKKLSILKNNGSLSHLLMDHYRHIWITNLDDNKVGIIDPVKETIAYFDKSAGLSDDRTFDVMQDRQNRIWIGTYKGADIIDVQQHKISYADHSTGLASDTVDALYSDSKGNVWMTLASGKTTGGTVQVLNPAQGTSRTIHELDQPGAFCIKMSEDRQGRVWIPMIKNELGVIDLQNNTASVLGTANGFNSDYFTGAFMDSRGQMWITTLKGIHIIANNDVLKQQIGGSDVLSALYEDDRGQLWVGALPRPSIVDLKNNTVRNLYQKHLLSNDSVQTIKKLDQRLAVCTNSGLDLINESAHTVERFTKKQGLTVRTITGVVMDKTGRLWLGSSKEGIDVCDLQNKTVKHIGQAEGLTDNNITDMKIDNAGLIWIATNGGGVNCIDPGHYTIRTLNNAAGLKEKSSKVLMTAADGRIWIGTAQGIYIADRRDNELIHLREGLLSNQVTSLLQRDNLVYVSTVKGINIITPPATKSSGWHNRWLGSAYGVTKLEPNNFLNDGISKNGDYLWGDYGVIVLNLSKKDTSSSIPYINGIKVMDQRQYFAVQGSGTGRRGDRNGLKWDSLSRLWQLPVNLQVPFNQNFLQFQFSCLNLSRRDSSWYRYRLIGADERWSEFTNDAVSRNYVNLQPGTYTFEVVVQNQNGSWSKPAAFSFVILPPWWQTWWFRLLLLMGLVALVWLVTHYRSRSLFRAKKLLEHKVALRTQEVTEQKEELAAQRDNLERALEDLKLTQTQLIQSEKMASLGELTAGIAHEIQNPLNFVNNFSEVNMELIDELKAELKSGQLDEAIGIADELKQNEEKVRHHGKRAEGIVKGMLQHSRASSGQKEITELNTLVDEYLRLAYHGLRAKDKSFNAELITRYDDTLPKLKIVPQDIGRVLLNLFTNAFYAVQQKKKMSAGDYKPAVRVETFAPPSGGWGVRVRDNGTGIPQDIREKIMQPFFTTKPTGEGTGLGLSLSYDIVVKGHGGKLDVHSEEGEFTEFVITLPAE